MDNVSTPTVKDGVIHQRVPLKLDASALTNAMNKLAGQQMRQEQVNTADYIVATSARIKSLYARFDAAKSLAVRLHGLLPADPLPPELTIDSISINYRIDGQNKVVELYSAGAVGDIAALLSKELGVIVATLQQEASMLKNVSEAAEASATKAFNAWQASNKNMQIVAQPAIADGDVAAAAEVSKEAETAPSNDNYSF
ncbi:hypothetical protein EBZ39_03490 [bacterium]|nr:hypothetical protein [bacterium]